MKVSPAFKEFISKKCVIQVTKEVGEIEPGLPKYTTVESLNKFKLDAIVKNLEAINDPRKIKNEYFATLILEYMIFLRKEKFMKNVSLNTLFY